MLPSPSMAEATAAPFADKLTGEALRTALREWF
jgi:hypothetical protein